MASNNVHIALYVSPNNFPPTFYECRFCFASCIENTPHRLTPTHSIAQKRWGPSQRSTVTKIAKICIFARYEFVRRRLYRGAIINVVHGAKPCGISIALNKRSIGIFINVHVNYCPPKNLKQSMNVQVVELCSMRF